MKRNIGAELVARLKHMNASLESITPSESDSPQPVASEAEIDALEYVLHRGVIATYDRPVLLAWLARLQAERTPAEPSTPGEGTRQSECPYVTGTVTRYCTLTPFTLTDAEREAVLYCVSCAQDYRDEDGSEERATQMIEIAMRLAMPQVGPAPAEGPRTASVTPVGGAGPTLRDAEREALEVAVEYVGAAYAVEHHAETIRKLLERLT